MSLQMRVPTVGESITEVTIAQWLKQDGDFVELDEVIAEIESDKATFELPAEGAGILRIKAEEGDTLEIGALICEIEPAEGQKGEVSSEAAPESTPTPDSGPKATGEVHEMIVPTVGESITEVTVSQWLKEDGDYVELDEVIAEIDSDKATFELPAEATGTLRIIAQEGDTLEIGALICKIEKMEGEAPAATATSPVAEAQATTAVPATGGYAEGHASPAAAKILAEKGISASEVKGTGVGGRITKEDAEKAQKATAKPAPKAAPSAAKAEPAAPAPFGGSREQKRQKMSSLRKTIAKRLVAAKNETAMLTTFNEVNMQPIMDLRKKYKEKFKEKHEVNLGFMSFFTKAVCMALEEWPAVNAQIDGNEIIYNDFADISIAVSAPKGLVVPVIRNAESMSFDQIEKEVVRLAVKARENKLTIEEMTGGTFTITNGGIFGSMLSTPIINAPQSAILGMHNIVQRAVVENGEIVIRPMMYVALSYDHRIIDGRESVSFLVRVKELLEDPTRLLLGV
ncbi:2-oxoglutarate dehydrogenase complex dihydrolipoyllysine-residue succinyltransferase [Xanthovirga aplysinae]|uniref:2-oxoglutarate dehydrogenase complex dihydrolipoyllysine-residue succinyltransferase n=1 Tax=Xanthovirga aplysinae TaxID=2529853 RepID=UPI0012BC74A7|nr:2-oxoglutarate dehydrogenase complex dihydrolipoyllysine-residue succinyltransferase [Xanthovirga aplysinae]MTI33061.1 2-oxoglutarate dehydrogenase complex dihydrolipoyllysine-residue succinyltransferase [Xanthovirga aplysinae]